MKQHISHKQWLELSKEAREKFLAWSEKHHRNYPFQPKLEVGQMIEFLEENYPQGRGLTLFHSPGGDMSFPRWMVSFNYDNKNTQNEEELIDALWKATKALLESV